MRRPLVVPGLYKINCDAHLWERAWVYVSPHDSVAVTDADGRFVLKNIPPGNYRIRVWHEGWAEKGKERAGRLEFQPMEESGDVRVTENETTIFAFESLEPTFSF
jgi:hypothetical protein